VYHLNGVIVVEIVTDPTMSDIRGHNSLHHAVQNDEMLTSYYLFGTGVNVDVTDREGHTGKVLVYVLYEETLQHCIGQHILDTLIY
jgi:hypothetical protein